MKKEMPHNLALLTDLYELTMAASYFEHKQDCLASFDLFIRDLPEHRSFFVSAGLEDVIEFIRNFRFDRNAIEYLKGQKIFSKDFLRYLGNLKFRGNLWAVPEGTVFFPNEPVIRVVAPIIEAQLIESCLLNTVNLQTTIATKAARVVLAAKGRGVFDFALRRTHGLDAANKVARSSYIAGFSGTSNVMAGKIYGIPVVGTMAHSFVMSFNNELDSFRAFVKTFSDNAILLVDTYDTVKGVHNALRVARELEKKGKRLKAIRLDSGDLAQLAKKARKIFDKEGLCYVKILASGNLDEYKIEELLKQDAPIDSFGVGTKMGVSQDAPYCDVIYKLCEITDIRGKFLPTMKLSKGKLTYPGRKQVYRSLDGKGRYKKDVLGLEGEKIKGDPLLRKIVDNGIVVYEQPKIEEIRSFTIRNLSRLPAGVTKINAPLHFPVHVSPGLRKLTQKITQRIQKKIK